MEKDNFKDRTIETTKFSAIKSGMIVFICEKQAQKYAKEMKDLTCVEVVDVLTKHDHPRGIKVRGYVYAKDERGYFKTHKIAVGRVVYIAKVTS